MESIRRRTDGNLQRGTGCVSVQDKGPKRTEITYVNGDPKVVKVGNLVIVGVSAYTWGVPDANKNRNVGMYSMLKRCTY